MRDSKLRATKIVLLLPTLLVSGCISYSSSPPPVPSTAAIVCLYGGQPYSPGAKVYPPNSAALQCRSDGSWAPL